MDPRQQAVFERYVALGNERSLPKLYESISKDDNTISMRMLQRWSQKFDWKNLAETVNDKVAQEVAEAMRPIIKERMREQLSTLQSLQRRFEERFGLDPNDPNLTPEQRLRVIDPDFRDYMDAVKMERLITGDPTERREVNVISDVAEMLTREDMLEVARIAAMRKFGGVVRLPPAEVIDVTPEEKPDGP